ncbi:GH14396 [Drosophila grimshawi]|uniref:GH14396 n=1 Tax=Drosophila grimshawi TaxID=7222 RepID=B4J1B1_DROGR|nr:GH14396 [Drosophila grimshawi]
MTMERCRDADDDVHVDVDNDDDDDDDYGNTSATQPTCNKQCEILRIRRLGQRNFVANEVEP